MYCKNTKEWLYCDYYDRDAPAIWFNNTLLIGNKGSTHATMVQEMIYGMDFEEDYINLYEKEWNNEGETEIDFGRDKIDNDSNYIFGHVVGREIYWEIYDNVKEECFLKLKNYKDKKYTHYVVGVDKYKLLTAYRIKDYNFNHRKKELGL